MSVVSGRFDPSFGPMIRAVADAGKTRHAESEATTPMYFPWPSGLPLGQSIHALIWAKISSVLHRPPLHVAFRTSTVGNRGGPGSLLGRGGGERLQPLAATKSA